MPEQIEQPEQLQLSLPYEDFTGLVGSQAYAKVNYSRGNDILVFQIPFEDILIWEGYNARTIYENIPELADSLLKHKQKVPFQLVLLKDGRAFLKKGGRRHRAYLHLIEKGLFDPKTKVPFELTSTRETMEEMILDLYTSNNLQEKLLPIDQAEVAFRLKYLCGAEKSNEEIAEKMVVSRQTVDNLILIALQPDDVKNEIRKGTMSFTEAVSFIRRQRRDKKETEKKEDASRQTSMAAPSLPEDPLKKDMEGLAVLEEQAEEFKLAAANRERQRMEKLYEVANEVLVNKKDLKDQLGKRLADDAVLIQAEEFVNENSGEVLPVQSKTVVLTKGTEITEETVKILLDKKVQSVFIYKLKTVAESVITEPPAQEEKSKYDQLRPEISAITKAIQCFDKIVAIVNKVEGVSEQAQKDLEYNLHWGQVNLSEAREWIHNHKQQNKRGH